MATPQMSMNQGLTLFGHKGMEVVRTELLQLYDQKGIKAKAAKELTPSQKWETLGYLMFLKQT